MDLPGDESSGLAYLTADVLLLFADQEDGFARGRAAASLVGCRIAAEAPLHNGVERFDRQLRCDAVLVVASRPSPDFDALVERLNAAGRERRVKSIIATSFETIEAFCASDPPAEVDLLIDPNAVALGEAIKLATETTPSLVYEFGKKDTVLQRLSEEAARLANVLAALSESEDENEDAGAADALYVRSIIRARRLRDQFFQSELFADPGFDMLLDLYAAHLEGNRVSVSSLCIAAAVPATTALRWIRALTEKGLFVRTFDTEDGRRIYISLSDESARAMGRYLRAIQSLPVA